MNLSVFYEHIAEAANQEKLPLENILEQVYACGIRYVEIEAERLLGEEGEKILAKLEEAGLSVSCIYRFFDWGYCSDRDRGHELVLLAKRVKAGRVMVIPGFLRREEAVQSILAERSAAGTAEVECAAGNLKAEQVPLSPREIVQRLSKNVWTRRMSFMTVMIRELCDYAAVEAPGLMILMEDFDDYLSPCATLERLKGFAADVNRSSFGITLDTGNFFYSGEDVLEAYEVLKPWIRHVHLKDRALSCLEEGDEGKAALNGEMMYPAAVLEGAMPIGEIVKRLMNTGYEGIYAIEHFGAAKQLETMSRSAKNLLEHECV